VRAVEMFAADVSAEEIAKRLRVTQRSVYRWTAAWQANGSEGVAGKGPPGRRDRLSRRSLVKLAAMLDEGPAAHGWDEDQVWTGARVTTLIGRRFHVSFSVSGATRLMRRLGFTPQQPARRAVQRYDAAVAAWKETTWPEIKRRRPRSVDGSASRTRPGRT
jgi:transposase